MAWGNAFTMRSTNPCSSSPASRWRNFIAHEHKDALDKDGLAGRSRMPNRLVGITLSARVVGGRIAAWLDRPKIDPRHGRSVLVAECHGAEYRKSSGAIDNERGASSGHGRSSQNFR